jgi:hypothetical protein
MPADDKSADEARLAGRRRPRGTGRIFQKHGNWYGQWQGLTRKLGPVRPPGSREGLTRGMAEARLRDRISEMSNVAPRVTERATVGDAGRRRIKELARKGRKVDTTLANGGVPAEALAEVSACVAGGADGRPGWWRA